MVANSGKFQKMFLGLSIDNNSIIFLVEEKRIQQSSNEVKLLDITIAGKLIVTKHINNLCKMANNYLIGKPFRGKAENNSINKIHKQLRKKCPYSELFWSLFSPNAGNYVPE